MLTVVILFRQCKTTCEQTKIRTPVWWHCLPCSWGEVKNSATDGSQNSPQPPFTQFIYHVHMYTVQYSGLYTFYTGWLTGVHCSTLHTAGKLRTYIVTVLLPSMVREGLWWWWRSGGGGQTEIYLPLLGRRDTAHHNQPAGVGRNPGRVCTVQCASRRLVKCLFS